MSKKVLITGGSNGLGQCLAKHYQQDRGTVDVLDIESPQENSGIRYHCFDLGHFDESKLPDFNDPFDVVICNAGISVSGNFTHIPHDKELEVFEINFMGHMQLIKYLLKNNLVKQGGRIAFICSATQYLSFPIALAYSASKGALDGFAQSLESYLINKGISVTRVYPGPMNTAHSKYYPGASTEGGRLPQQSVGPIVRGIEKRRRKVCPDPVSRFYRLASKFIPKTLSKKTYHFYKDRINSTSS